MAKNISFKQNLKQLFEKGVITKEKYQNELFEIEMTKNKNKKPTRLYEGLKEEEFIQLLKCYSSIKHRIILLLAYKSGLRLSEILNLEKDDFDFNSKTIFIRKGKFGKDRITILPNQFKKIYLDYVPFVNNKGRRLSKIGVQKLFFKKTMKCNINKVIDKYQLKTGKERNIYKYHFHCLRHGFAVNLLKKGVPLNYVQKLLGHSNIQSTSVYTNVEAQDAIKLALEKDL